jgi:hypothetical protein
MHREEEEPNKKLFGQQSPAAPPLFLLPHSPLYLRQFPLLFTE